MMHRRRHPERGFTLAESLLASAVLAMAVTATTLPFTAGAGNELHDARLSVAVSLAQEMLEEILSRPFEDPQGASQPGPEVSEDQADRTTLDNLDDYDGLMEPAGYVTNMAGVRMTESIAQGLSRSVSAAYVYVSGQDTSLAPTFIRITVEAKYNGESLVKLTRLVYSQSPPVPAP